MHDRRKDKHLAYFGNAHDWETTMRRLLLLLALAGSLGGISTPLRAAAPVEKVILDTDIGDDIDDAYALALLASSPDVKLLGVTTTWGETAKRAQIAAKMLARMGRGDVPVSAGHVGTAHIGRQYEWARSFSSAALGRDDAVTFLKQQIEKAPGQITIIGIGPLVNLGDLVTRFPDVKSKIKRIVLMGGAVSVGYNNQAPPVPEWNIKCDPQAARAVFESGVPLVMAGLEVTTMMQLDAERQKRLFADGTPATDALAALTNLWGGGTPTLFDVVAVADALGHGFCDAERRHVVVRDDGLTEATDGPPNVTVLVSPHRDQFLDWYVTTLTTQKSVGHGQAASSKRHVSTRPGPPSTANAAAKSVPGDKSWTNQGALVSTPCTGSGGDPETSNAWRSCHRPDPRPLM